MYVSMQIYERYLFRLYSILNPSWTNYQRAAAEIVFH